MDLLLETKNLNKRYGNTLALDNVSLTIHRGDIYGFVGENGAGKSTLIRIVTNVNNRSSGEVTLNVSDRPGSVAAIVETPALHHRLSAFDNLRYQNDLLGLKKRASDLNDLLRSVGLGDQVDLNKPSKNFSLGMKQRLSIAMALLSDPEFVLLDEPMNGLDPLGIKDMRDLILKLNQERNVTFLISSHILSELDKIATVYGFISHGRLLKEVSAKELHASVGSYVKIKLGTPLSDASILEGIPYKTEDEALIFDDETKGQQAMQRLIKGGLTVTNFEVVKASIEDYYFNIIGGGR